MVRIALIPLTSTNNPANTSARLPSFLRDLDIEFTKSVFQFLGSGLIKAHYNVLFKFSYKSSANT